MKKFAIILAVILVSGLTAFSLTRNEKKAEVAKINSDKAAVEMSHATQSNDVGTAD